MKTVRNFVFAAFFGMIAVGAVPMGASVTTLAMMAGCQVTDVTPGGCEYAQQQEAGCHCNFEVTCANSALCTDAWEEAQDTCENLPEPYFLEGFNCTDPYEPPVEATFYCAPYFGCVGG
jgi:hypothetical protein